MPRHTQDVSADPTLATNVLIVKKFLNMGLSTPFKYAFTSGMPLPDAAGDMTHITKQHDHASSALKPAYCRNFTNTFSFSSCKHADNTRR